MRLVTYSSATETRALGVVVGNGVISLAKVDSRLPRDMLTLIGRGADALERVREISAHARPQPLETVRLLAPIPQPPEFLGVGLNYRDHAAEAGLSIPSEPLIFNKQTSCVSGPYDDIEKPRESEQLDYEAELGIVIGQARRHLSRDAARAAIYGYLVVNDVSVRDWQLKSPTHTLGKSFDSHGPCGPWIVTADEVPDSGGLSITTRVNDEIRQQGSTSDMIFDCPYIVAYLSKVMTLRPGTLITTGTPAGVGLVRKPPAFLRVGDRVSIEISRLGRLENRIVDAPL